MQKPRCVKQVATAGMGLHFHQCLRAGFLKHKGKLYCKIHYPPNVEARDKVRLEKYNAEWEAKEQKWERQAALRNAHEAVVDSAKVWYDAHGPKNRRAAAVGLWDSVEKLKALEETHAKTTLGI